MLWKDMRAGRKSKTIPTRNHCACTIEWAIESASTIYRVPLGVDYSALAVRLGNRIWKRFRPNGFLSQYYCVRTSPFRSRFTSRSWINSVSEMIKVHISCVWNIFTIHKNEKSNVEGAGDFHCFNMSFLLCWFVKFQVSFSQFQITIIKGSSCKNAFSNVPFLNCKFQGFNFQGFELHISNFMIESKH